MISELVSWWPLLQKFESRRRSFGTGLRQVYPVITVLQAPIDLVPGASYVLRFRVDGYTVSMHWTSPDRGWVCGEDARMLCFWSNRLADQHFIAIDVFLVIIIIIIVVDVVVTAHKTTTVDFPSTLPSCPWSFGSDLLTPPSPTISSLPPTRFSVRNFIETRNWRVLAGCGIVVFERRALPVITWKERWIAGKSSSLQLRITQRLGLRLRSIQSFAVVQGGRRG